MSTRSTGRYITQKYGYKAFIPEKLPPQILYSNELLEALSKADSALGRLDGAAENLPNRERFINMYVKKEAVLSSQIEGTQASLMDLLEFEAEKEEQRKAARTKKDMDKIETSNYVTALNFGLERVKDFPLSLRLIREIHAKLLAETRGSERNPGEFRNTQNWIGAEGCSLNEAIFIPPPPSDMMDAMGDLEKYIHSEEKIPFLIKVGLIHSQFETIHPFLDGNGRMGRLLITFLLCHNGTLRYPLLYLSLFFKKNREQYYQRLQAVRDDDRWEEWLLFFLRGVYEVAQDAQAKAREIIGLREAHRAKIVATFPKNSGRLMQLLEFLYESPVVDVQMIKRHLESTTSTANTAVNTLEAMSILHEITGNRRNRVFVYQDYVDALEGITAAERQEHRP